MIQNPAHADFLKIHSSNSVLELEKTLKQNQTHLQSILTFFVTGPSIERFKQLLQHVVVIKV
jgi:hypothetical protein